MPTNEQCLSQPWWSSKVDASLPGGKHMGAIRAGRLAPTLGNLDNSRPKRQMAAKGHVRTPRNYPLGWFLGLFIATLQGTKDAL